MNEKNNPVQRPGDGARAFDTIQKHFITDGEFSQAFESAKRFLEQQYGTGGHEGYYEGFVTLISYIAGYAANMPLHVAYDGTRKILHERYGIEDNE